MAWIYLAESEDSQSPSMNGSDPSPTAKSTPIVRECFAPICPMEESEILRSGMISDHFPGIGFMGLLISFMEDFPARTSVLQDMEKAWKESEAAYFSRSYAWPKKSSPHSYSLKTFQPSLHVGDYESLEKLPKWGMTVDGVLYPLRPLERYTVERGGSYWATPNTLDHMPLRSEEALKHQFTNARKGRTKPANLREQVHPECWPQNLWPTPRASDHKRNDSPSDRNRDSPCLPSVVNMQASTRGKKLCPLFVELLMGYPLDHTELNPWAMQWFQSKRKKRSKS